MTNTPLSGSIRPVRTSSSVSMALWLREPNTCQKSTLTTPRSDSMPCPVCGAPCYYRYPIYSPHKDKDYEYDYAKCLGHTERKADKKRGITAQEATEPCGWEDGNRSYRRIEGEPLPAEEVEQRHTNVRSTGRLVLKDYR